MTTKSSKKPAKKGSKSTKSSTSKRTTKTKLKKSEAASAAPDSFRKSDVGGNGLRSFAFHRQDKGANPGLKDQRGRTPLVGDWNGL